MLTVRLTLLFKGLIIEDIGTEVICTDKEVVMATARIDMRINEETKVKAEKASALLGLKSLTEYIVRLVDEDASKVIAEHESITLSDDVFDRFMHACAKADKPNRALKDAVAFTQEKGIK